MEKEYKANGLVYGKYWGGGEGSYQAESYQSKTKKGLDKLINKGVNDGSIDSGMGYQEILGAFMIVEKIITIKKDGEEYKRSEHNGEFYGNLAEKQQDFLESVSCEL